MYRVYIKGGAHSQFISLSRSTGKAIIGRMRQMAFPNDRVLIDWIDGEKRKKFIVLCA